MIIQLEPQISRVTDEQTGEERDLIGLPALPDSISPESVISMQYDGVQGKWLVEVKD